MIQKRGAINKLLGSHGLNWSLYNTLKKGISHWWWKSISGAPRKNSDCWSFWSTLLIFSNSPRWGNGRSEKEMSRVQYIYICVCFSVLHVFPKRTRARNMWIIHFQFRQNIWIFLIEIPCKHVNFFPHRRRDNLVQEKAGGREWPGPESEKKRNVTSWECPRETKIGTKAVVKNTWIYCGFSRLRDSIVVNSVQHLALF